MSLKIRRLFFAALIVAAASLAPLGFEQVALATNDHDHTTCGTC